jgi:hypothetical protein
MGAGTLIKHHTISSKDYACRLHYMKTKIVIIFDSYPIAFVQAYLKKLNKMRNGFMMPLGVVLKNYQKGK